jgi:hypothetical protein
MPDQESVFVWQHKLGGFLNMTAVIGDQHEVAKRNLR